MLVSNAFNYFGENEMLYFTNAPYKLAEALTFSLQEARSERHEDILKILGDLICFKDELCTYIVSGPRADALKLCHSL